ncbi:hypothetical protein VNO78_12789 [Psophocarpus tetragonolobus]|uniref:RING-type E3 ubiquitin transferase n=1 Tax=Psophocarpus tetragonolobus TaxID=3891 RepID=A0AAN9SNS8_PSOTE
MGSMPFVFSWDVICAPFDESQLENYDSLEQEQENLGDYFHIKVNVTHQLCFIQPQSLQTPSTIPFNQFLFQNCMFLHSQQFFENGPSYMQMYFPHPIIPNELIHSMMSEVATYAKAVLQNPRFGFHYESPNFRLFTLVLDIFIQKLYDEHDDDISNMIMMESMREMKMVPTSNTAIESLTKVKLEDGAVKERCSICLREFDEGVEVSLMPCKHVYHHECLIKWLKISHMCPMCRYPMPTSGDH